MALRESMRNSAAADAISLPQRKVWASSAFVPALVRGLVQGKLVPVVIFGALAALTIWLWLLVIRGCGRLDIAASMFHSHWCGSSTHDPRRTPHRFDCRR